MRCLRLADVEGCGRRNVVVAVRNLLWALIGLTVIGPTLGLAQDTTFAFPAPAPGIHVARDVRYGASGSTTLMMDVYRPPGALAAQRVPALIIFHRGTGADRSAGYYGAWARAAASNGLVAILPDLREGSEVADYRQLASYLSEHAGELGVDGDAVALFAGSANVSVAFPLVEEPSQTIIKAAVMYYGTAAITEFRREVPVLYVRAGLDRPDVNQRISALASLALSQNAPVTLLNHSSGHHGFETVDVDAATRGVIEQTLEFVRRAVAPAYRTALRASLAEATAAGHVQTGRFAEASRILGELVVLRPDDARLRLSFGEALYGSGQFATACAEFEKLKGKGLGARDLGLPAARACMRKGDPAAAIAWLRSIPPRFLPPDMQNDAVFAPIRDQEEFRALFRPR